MTSIVAFHEIVKENSNPILPYESNLFNNLFREASSIDIALCRNKIMKASIYRE